MNQSISEQLQDCLRDLMHLVENFVRDSAPGDLYTEWAKKQECWLAIKDKFGKLELPIDSGDLLNPEDLSKRRSLSKEEIETAYYKEIELMIKNIKPEKWKRIYLYCRDNKEISENLTNAVHTLGRKLKDGIRPTSREILLVNDLLNKVIFKTSILDTEEL